MIESLDYLKFVIKEFESYIKELMGDNSKIEFTTEVYTKFCYDNMQRFNSLLFHIPALGYDRSGFTNYLELDVINLVLYYYGFNYSITQQEGVTYLINDKSGFLHEVTNVAVRNTICMVKYLESRRVFDNYN